MPVCIAWSNYAKFFGQSLGAVSNQSALVRPAPLTAANVPDFREKGQYGIVLGLNLHCGLPGWMADSSSGCIMGCKEQ